MPEFLKLIEPSIAIKGLLDLVPTPSSEKVDHISTEDSLFRVISRDYFAKEPSPPFSRSTVDGYAVRAQDSNGANDSLPMYLKVIGEVLMGQKASFVLNEGEAVLIHTGGMLPQNANAVVMLENTQVSRKDEVEIHRTVSRDENTIQKGEDVQKGDLIISKGSQIRAMEIGGLLSQGINKIDVYPIPCIGIISSGDEVVPPTKDISDGQIRDINSYTLANLIKGHGGNPVLYGISPDRLDDLKRLVQKAYSECDAVLVTAGSSVSARDITKDVIASLGEPGIIVHGINIKPGKPTILAICGQKPVLGLPGNPVSAFVIASLFFVPILEKLAGITQSPIRPVVKAKLKINLSSIAGRTDYVPVKLSTVDNMLSAEPIFFKSNLIFSLVRANGLAIVPAEANGISAGEMVDVLLI
jgi:molybdopterin molybdotransferase